MAQMLGGESTLSIYSRSTQYTLTCWGAGPSDLIVPLCGRDLIGPRVCSLTCFNLRVEIHSLEFSLILWKVKKAFTSQHCHTTGNTSLARWDQWNIAHGKKRLLETGWRWRRLCRLQNGLVAAITQDLPLTEAAEAAMGLEVGGCYLQEGPGILAGHPAVLPLGVWAVHQMLSGNVLD